MKRRQFLVGGVGMGMTFAVGSAFWERAFAAPAQPGESPYGPLLPPDDNGLMLPEGFRSRIVAQGLQPVAGTGYRWNVFPDGGACVPAGDGGWIYVSNSEFPPPLDVDGTSDLMALLAPFGPPLTGRASAVRFDAGGGIVDAYEILGGTQSNCAGGLGPRGTWLSCEEFEESSTAGRVWECDPFGIDAPVAHETMGVFKHEMVATDAAGRRLYLTEDLPDGLFYRYTPDTWPDLAAGLLEAAAVDPTTGATTWLPVPDPTAIPVRSTVAGATRFDGGEGVVHDQGRVYFTTKGDDRVWVHDVAAQTLTVLYDAAEFPNPVLNGVDNIIVSAAHDLYVAEDGGNLEVNIITPEFVVGPVVRMTGAQHGLDPPGPPFQSEVSGLAFSPDGNRLYFNSMRALVTGILYEVTGPWRGGTLTATPPPAVPIPVREPVPAEGTGRQAAPRGSLPATGGGASLVGAGLLGAAGAALWRLRRRAGGQNRRAVCPAAGGTGAEAGAHHVDRPA